MIAHAEDLLYPGKRPAAQVGILFPRSSFVWDTVSVPGELQNLESELTTACSAFFISPSVFELVAHRHSRVCTRSRLLCAASLAENSL